MIFCILIYNSFSITNQKTNQNGLFYSFWTLQSWVKIPIFSRNFSFLEFKNRMIYVGDIPCNSAFFASSFMSIYEQVFANIRKKWKFFLTFLGFSKKIPSFWNFFHFFYSKIEWYTWVICLAIQFFFASSFMSICGQVFAKIRKKWKNFLTFLGIFLKLQKCRDKDKKVKLFRHSRSIILKKVIVGDKFFSFFYLRPFMFTKLLKVEKKLKIFWGVTLKFHKYKY